MCDRTMRRTGGGGAPPDGRPAPPPTPDPAGVGRSTTTASVVSDGYRRTRSPRWCSDARRQHATPRAESWVGIGHDGSGSPGRTVAPHSASASALISASANVFTIARNRSGSPSPPAHAGTRQGSTFLDAVIALVSFDHDLVVSKDLRDDRLLLHDTPSTRPAVHHLPGRSRATRNLPSNGATSRRSSEHRTRSAPSHPPFHVEPVVGACRKA